MHWKLVGLLSQGGGRRRVAVRQAVGWQCVRAVHPRIGPCVPACRSGCMQAAFYAGVCAKSRLVYMRASLRLSACGLLRGALPGSVSGVLSKRERECARQCVHAWHLDHNNGSRVCLCVHTGTQSPRGNSQIPPVFPCVPHTSPRANIQPATAVDGTRSRPPHSKQGQAVGQARATPMHRKRIMHSTHMHVLRSTKIKCKCWAKWRLSSSTPDQQPTHVLVSSTYAPLLITSARSCKPPHIHEVQRPTNPKTQHRQHQQHPPAASFLPLLSGPSNRGAVAGGVWAAGCGGRPWPGAACVRPRGGPSRRSLKAWASCRTRRSRRPPPRPRTPPRSRERSVRWRVPEPSGGWRPRCRRC